MNVSIITLHHVRNFGSMLQTYATQHILEENGINAEVIDFIPQGLTLITGIKTIKPRGNIILRIIRRAGATVTFSISQINMRSFLKKYIKLTKTTYHTFDDLCKNPPKADCYISGSDQIWNTQNYNKNDDVCAYYLAFGEKDTKRISYASSIGKDAFSEEESKNVKNWLARFSAISVRESQAVELLNSIGICNATHVLDPTMLLSSNDWLNFCTKRNKKPEEYIFVYNLNRNAQIKKYAVDLSKKYNMKIINFSDTLDFIKGAENKFGNTPFDFIDYISNATYVLTDSFHGTAFSINFNRQFLTFSAPKYNSRIESILNLFNLKDRLIIGDRFNLEQIDSLIDYSQVNIMLNQERKKSLNYLFDALK